MFKLEAGREITFNGIPCFTIKREIISAVNADELAHRIVQMLNEQLKYEKENEALYINTKPFFLNILE
jgi:hypothetical protein